MKRSNWKRKALIFVGGAAGILVGAIAATVVNGIYPPAAGLAFFGGIALGAITVVGIGAKIGIGRD